MAYKGNDRLITINNTEFMYWGTNLSGNPEKDSYGDTRRKCDIMIPDDKQAEELLKLGYPIRRTKPSEDSRFEQHYFVTAQAKYRDKYNAPMKYPPMIHIVSEDGIDTLLDEDTVGDIDRLYVSKVKVVLNPWEYDPINKPGEYSFQIRTMYVEIGDDPNDPFAEEYRLRREERQREREYSNAPF